MVRSRFLVLLAATALISACLHDYDQFAAAGPKVDAPVTGGGGGVAGASGTSGGSGAAGAAGRDGPTAAGASGEGAFGGAAGAGEGGAAGTPLVCEAPTIACGDVCADTAGDEQHCGGCDNSCTEQSEGFEC